MTEPVPLPPGARVCVVLLTGLGDVVHGLPVVNALKDRDPTCRITWVVEPMPAPVLRPHSSVDEVVVYEKKKGLRGILDLRRALAGKRFDLALNLNVYFKSVWPTLLSRAPHRLGFDRGRAFEGVWLFSNHHLESRPRAHTQDMFLEFLERLGVPAPAPLEWRIPLTGEERRAQADFFAQASGGRPVCAVVPASANRKKDWLAERYAAVVDALEHDFGYRAVLVGGPGEREQAIAREIVALSRAKPAWALGDGIRRLLWLIEGSRLVIAPDTGPVHIARAFGVPVVGLYGHTNPWRVGPYRAYQELWIDRYTDPGEPPDPSRWDPKLGRMEQITVNDVLERIQRAAHLRS
ncbi:MAG TPA: glycosyltransferase family 9 protein [Longimicrobiaceae bacterium]|nr:glycosyltransferase family 9 protein [Longimicrobiaceae bacterium]